MGSPTIRILRWVALLPVGLGILLLVEYLLNLLVGRSLDWTLSGLTYYLVFFGGGLVVLLTIVLTGILTRIVAEEIAPSARKGLRLLGATYLFILTVGFCGLFIAGTTWQGITTKLAFILVVAVLFLRTPEDPDT